MKLDRFGWWLLVFYVGWGIPHDCNGQRYAIMAPEVVRPYSTYNLVMTNIGTKREKFKCDIVNANNTVVASAEAEVKPNELKPVEMTLNGLAHGKYKLVLRDSMRGTTLNTTNLEYTDRSYLVLFQTDKAMYKPGDKVLFRVIFLLPDTKPIGSAVKPNVYITNADRHRIKQWTDIGHSNGVFEGELQLAEYTTIGRWMITATVNDQTYSDSFQVEEYILPVFTVQINSNPESYFRCTDSFMNVTLKANYAHGGRVRGNATVVVRANYNNYPSQTKEVDRKQVTINGSTNVLFPVSTVTTDCDWNRNVWFDLTVTETSTGITYNTTSMFVVRNCQNFTMDVVDSVDTFYPNTPIWVKIRLATIDGVPLKNQTVSIYHWLRSEEDEDNEREVEPVVNELTTNLVGIVKLSINTSMDTASVTMEGKYKDETFPLGVSHGLYQDSSLDYLTAYTQEAYHVVNRNVSLNLYSNLNMQRIFYVGYCREKVCDSGVISLRKASRHHRLVLKAVPKMIPLMKFVAFVVKDDGKVVSVAIAVRVKKGPSSDFYIKATEVDSYSKKYRITVESEQNAFIGLLGVDRRVALGWGNAKNDISLDKLTQAIRLHDSASAPWNSYDSFGSVGVTLLTDGYLQDVESVPHILNELRRSGVPTSGESVREDFSETWIWQSFQNASRIVSVEEPVPDTITTWQVTGFSVGPVNGLQISVNPLRIKSEKPVFAQLHVPSSIKRLETVTAYCLIHNSGNPTNVSVDVQPFQSVKHLTLKRQATETVPIQLHSETAGPLEVKIVVRNSNGAVIDSMKQMIMVHPEGMVRVVEDLRLLVYPQHSTASFDMSLDSLKVDRTKTDGEVTLSVVGTFLNLNQIDLEELLDGSYGNGEETLLFLQTAMAVYDYLRASNRVRPGGEDKYMSYMEVGYQQLLQYRMHDGSFSVFGKLHACGGVWFTASSTETLQKLSAYIPVSESVIRSALDWLQFQSMEDGSFNETCSIVHPHIQRTGGKELSLACSVMFAFVHPPFVDQFEELRNSTISLLVREPIADVYLLAKTTYLLFLIGHPDRSSMLRNLNERIVKEGMCRYWRVPSTLPGDVRNLETTAYALLANLEQRKGNSSAATFLDENDMVCIAHWMQKHAFPGDGYAASLEKIVVLRALAELAPPFPAAVTNMHIRIGDQENQIILNVNRSNEELLQTVPLPKSTEKIRIRATGTGLVLIKLSYRYYETGHIGGRVALKPAVQINVTKHVVDDKHDITVCIQGRVPNFLKWHIHLPTYYEFGPQLWTYAVSPLSVIRRNCGTIMEVVLYMDLAVDVCYPITTLNRFESTDLPGYVFVSSFDTKEELGYVTF